MNTLRLNEPGRDDSPLAAIKEAERLAAYNQEPYVVILHKGSVIACADRIGVVPYGAAILERCWP